MCRLLIVKVAYHRFSTPNTIISSEDLKDEGSTFTTIILPDFFIFIKLFEDIMGPIEQVHEGTI